jgi:hypothetical protein
MPMNTRISETFPPSNPTLEARKLGRDNLWMALWSH